jgi:hypothetical protein
MPRRNNKNATPVWFRVRLNESDEGLWFRAREEREAVREWCKEQDRGEFWRFNSTAIVETLYGGMNTHHPSRPFGLPKKWHVDASQPPAWIIEREPSEES